MNVIEFSNVKKTLGNFVLEIPKFEVKQGYITGFVGQNGAGKTTTIKLIMNMLFPDQGKVHIFGKEITKHSASIKKEIGYVGDPMGYHEDQVLTDIVRSIKLFRPEWDESLYKKYMKCFDLRDTHKFKAYSMGQKKQFALALTLACRPKLLILDEPTANLDPIVRNFILSILMEHMQSEETSILYSTHITTDLDKACDYVAYIQDGKIVFNEDKESLHENYYMVKGPKKLITQEVNKYLIHPESNAFGFEGLTKDYPKIKSLLGNEALYERATIEEIMIGLVGGRAYE